MLEGTIRKLSYNTRRVIAIFAGLPIVPLAINWIAGLHWFGRYDEGVMAIWLMVFVLIAFFIAPSPDEMREHRKKMR